MDRGAGTGAGGLRYAVVFYTSIFVRVVVRFRCFLFGFVGWYFGYGFFGKRRQGSGTDPPRS